MRTAVAYASELYKGISFPNLVNAVTTIQKDAIAEGHRQAVEPLRELSEEVDRRLERLKRGELWEDPEA
jgi:hypothetical protein